ncbi:MAG: hypothetical protein IIB38_05485 [Candidatus Hydrogenedentes bacterium]|nr:hypothetical protein [Candidatus Hydrogenedentota bacterium]
MSRRGIIVVPLVLALGVFLIYSFRKSPEPVSYEELAERVSASRPEWANYHEDLKAQVGVTPVAEWQGEPLQALQTGRQLDIIFDVTGPWSQRDVALPILVRDPFGGVYRDVHAKREKNRVTYRFVIDPSAEHAPVPWVEIQYPHHERRLVFSEEGTWSAEDRK